QTPSLHPPSNEVVGIPCAPFGLGLLVTGLLAGGITTSPLTSTYPWVRSEPMSTNTARSLRKVSHGDLLSPPLYSTACAILCQPAVWWVNSAEQSRSIFGKRRRKNEHRRELCRKTNCHALKHFEIFERHRCPYRQKGETEDDLEKTLSPLHRLRPKPMLTTEAEVVLHYRPIPFLAEPSFWWTLRESRRPAGAGLEPTGCKYASTHSSLLTGGRYIGASKRAISFEA